MVHVNDMTVLEDARAPLGGIGLSGNPTRIGGIADLEEYTTWRWVTEVRTPQAYLLPNKLLILNGGQRRDRTADAGLFRAALYH